MSPKNDLFGGDDDNTDDEEEDESLEALEEKARMEDKRAIAKAALKAKEKQMVEQAMKAREPAQQQPTIIPNRSPRSVPQTSWLA